MEYLHTTKEEVGEEYLDELNQILNIRKERKKIYGDSFLQMSFDHIKAIIDGKFSRLNVINRFENPQKWRDEAQDIVNYLLFLLTLDTREDAV